MQDEIRPNILIHICCAICAVYFTEILQKRFSPVFYFYNPNIQPVEEYQARKNSVKNLAEIYQIPFIDGPYNVSRWFQRIRGLEKEPEAGRRCLLCFRLRLQKTAIEAQRRRACYFTTTLLVSPHKDTEAIQNIGCEIGQKIGLNFINLKMLGQNKTDVWQKTVTKSRQYNFYHQKYCGCIFSSRPGKSASNLT